MSVELVATAHPTEITRQNVLDKHILVNGCLEELEASRSPGERRETIERLLEAITVLWQTDAMRSERPRVIDEVRRVLFFFEHILVDAAGAVQEELERLLAEHYPGVHPPHGVLTFGSWAGGDQDGNPNCTPDLIPTALGRHRDAAIRNLRDRVHPAGRRAGDLGADGGRQRRPPGLDRGRRGPHAGGLAGDPRPQRRRAVPAQALVRLGAPRSRGGGAATPTRTRWSPTCAWWRPRCWSIAASASRAAAWRACCGRSRPSASTRRAWTCASTRAACARRPTRSRRAGPTPLAGRRRGGRDLPRAAAGDRRPRAARRGHRDRELHPRGRGPPGPARPRPSRRPGAGGRRAPRVGRRPGAPVRDHRRPAPRARHAARPAGDPRLSPQRGGARASARS